MASRRAEGGRCGDETAEGMVTVGDERRCWGRIHHGERNVMAKTENGRSGKRTGGKKIFLLDTRPRFNPGTILKKVPRSDDWTAVGSGRGGNLL